MYDSHVGIKPYISEDYRDSSNTGSDWFGKSEPVGQITQSYNILIYLLWHIVTFWGKKLCINPEQLTRKFA